MHEMLSLELSRREREIQKILYQLLGNGSASDVKEAPSYSGVRVMLRVPEAKGHVKHENEGWKYVYAPAVNRDKAKRSAVKHLMEASFRNSPAQILTALLDVSAKRLTQEELDRMS
jgi:BlaI family penicillinase repressor